MFFFNCPGLPNCAQDWANTHAFGMNMVSSAYEAGFYNPNNYGFWLREVMDAGYAGLQFLLPNVYGPDLLNRNDVFQHINNALAQTPAVKFGMMDDTWGWGKFPGVTVFSTVPNIDDAQGAANTSKFSLKVTIVTLLSWMYYIYIYSVLCQMEGFLWKYSTEILVYH